MFNPLVDSFNELSDSDIDNKISELSRKYFQTHNPEVKQQISVILDMYREELRTRQAKQKLVSEQQSDENDLDNLIKVS